MSRRSLRIAVERFALRTPFVISRGAKVEATVVMATLEEAGAQGRGECVPYGRYGENVDSVVAALESVRAALEEGADRERLQGLLPAGAARNALDCALWDLEAKRLGIRAQDLAGLHRIAPATTAMTISVGTPEAMASQAQTLADFPILKLKLAGDGDEARIAAVRAAAPGAQLLVDANEAWREDDLPRLFAACEAAGVAVIEQPLPAGMDQALRSRPPGIPVCADESIHDRNGLADLLDRYDMVNIKLDKAGGLTEALAMAQEAGRLGFGIFLGCMVGTSLAMAPAMLLSPMARFVDLDGPLLLATDRVPGLPHEGAILHPPPPELWG